MSKTSVAALSMTTPARGAKPAAPSTMSIATLVLALAVALEAGGACLLPAVPGEAAIVATLDGTEIQAPVQRRVASVEISIVAQADMTAH